MFEIEYKGANSVIITTKGAKIVVDPKLSIVGLKDISTKGAVELATEERFSTNNPDALLSIEGPGAYGIAGFDISGIATRRHIDDKNDALLSTIYRIEIGETRIAIVGNIDEKLSDEQLEKIGLIDILIIPVGGGGYTLDATSASNVVRSIDPKIVIPIHYADNALKYEVPQDELKLFISELGVPVETVSKFKLKQSPIVATTMSIIEIIRS
ncbi:MAG: hypothetical protein PWQ10_638 [Patescibacteria group bacterium]|nr:hypothetical protein [Patescibacteria group bacterium]